MVEANRETGNGRRTVWMRSTQWVELQRRWLSVGAGQQRFLPVDSPGCRERSGGRVNCNLALGHGLLWLSLSRLAVPQITIIWPYLLIDPFRAWAAQRCSFSSSLPNAATTRKWSVPMASLAMARHCLTLLNFFSSEANIKIWKWSGATAGFGFMFFMSQHLILLFLLGFWPLIYHRLSLELPRPARRLSKLIGPSLSRTVASR